MAPTGMISADRTPGFASEPVHDDAGESARSERPVDVKQTMLDAVGGPWGIVASAVPTLVFATAIPFTSLPIAIGI